MGSGKRSRGEDAVHDDGAEVIGPLGRVGETDGVNFVDDAHAVLGEEDCGGGTEAGGEGEESGRGGGGFGGYY